MSFLSQPSQKQSHLDKHNKKRLSHDQVSLLEASFSSNKKLEPERKLQLARELGVPPRQIAIWYQNKRSRWKIQSLELDHSALQVRLEAALAARRQLEREVRRLHGELRKAQEILMGLDHAPSVPVPPPPPPLLPTAVSSLSSYCDEGGGSSSLQDDVSCPWVSNETLQLEELYACLMGADESNHS